MNRSPSGKQLTQSPSGKYLSPSSSRDFLPGINDLKFNSSYFVGSNPNRTVKAYDFMGYAKRREIYDNCTTMPIPPAPVDSRFEMPSELCPTISTKHKRTGKVSLGLYSPRIFFTDKLSDYPKSKPTPNKPLTMTMAAKEGKMPNETVLTAPPMAKLYAKNYGYRVCMNKKISSSNDKAAETNLFQRLMESDEEAEKNRLKAATATKKKAYVTISDDRAK